MKFPQGLHLRPASRLIRLIRRFRSQVHLRCGPKLANGRSLLNILLLGAAFNAELDIMASGEDEEEALQAVEVFFREDKNRESPVTVQQADFGPNSRSPEPSPVEGQTSSGPR